MCVGDRMQVGKEGVPSLPAFRYAGREGRCSFLTCIPDGHLHTVRYNRCRIDTIDSPDDEYGVARNV